MASKLLAICARILRPVMEEVVRQQQREEEMERAAMTPAEVQARVREYICSMVPIFDEIDKSQRSVH